MSRASGMGRLWPIPIPAGWLFHAGRFGAKQGAINGNFTP